MKDFSFSNHFCSGNHVRSVVYSFTPTNHKALVHPTPPPPPPWGGPPPLFCQSLKSDSFGGCCSRTARIDGMESKVFHFYYASLLSDLMGDKCFPSSSDVVVVRFRFLFFCILVGVSYCVCYSLTFSESPPPPQFHTAPMVWTEVTRKFSPIFWSRRVLWGKSYDAMRWKGEMTGEKENSNYGMKIHARVIETYVIALVIYIRNWKLWTEPGTELDGFVRLSEGLPLALCVMMIVRDYGIR